MRRLSQEQLANLAGLHRTYVSSVERGERNVSLDNMERLAEALSVSLSQLVREG
jgi:transcriptional regulator with XRE-family HTH domain